MPEMLQELNFYNVANSGFIAAAEDMFNGDPATDVVSMANYDEMIFIIKKDAGATGTATFTIESCDDVVPTVATAVPFNSVSTTVGNTIGAIVKRLAAGFTSVAGADQLYALSVKAAQLNGDDKYVRLKTVEVVDSPCDGAIIAIGVHGRFSHDVLPEMIT